MVGFSSSGAKLFNTCVAELSSSSEDKLSGFGATCVAGLSGHGGLRFGATCVAGLPGSGVEFWAIALSTYPTTKIAATDNDGYHRDHVKQLGHFMDFGV